MPINVSLQNYGSTGASIRVFVEGQNLRDIAWKRGAAAMLLSSTETTYVGPHSEKSLTFSVNPSRNETMKISVRVEIVHDCSSIGATITTLAGILGETPKTGETALEYRTTDGVLWSLFWAD